MRVQRSHTFLALFVVVWGCSGQAQQKADGELLDADSPVPQSTDNLDATISLTRRVRKLQAIRVDKMQNTQGLPIAGDTDAPKWQSKALGQSGQLLQSSENANVIFAGTRCMRGGSCGCTMEMRYFFGKAADGHIEILEPKPNVHTRIVKRPGSCGEGCGQPSPPQPPAYYELPVSDMKLVEFVEVPFELWDVVVTCEHPIARP